MTISIVNNSSNVLFELVEYLYAIEDLSSICNIGALGCTLVLMTYVVFSHQYQV